MRLRTFEPPGRAHAPGRVVALVLPDTGGTNADFEIGDARVGAVTVQLGANFGEPVLEKVDSGGAETDPVGQRSETDHRRPLADRRVAAVPGRRPGLGAVRRYSHLGQTLQMETVSFNDH
ncbi:MAG: hypothetical protein DCC49_10740 [Acidobacteria bacterium]|nr:MAG: hypothetical protein DCC49_10740 [Acidobacteriota bacterium]